MHLISMLLLLGCGEPAPDNKPEPDPDPDPICLGELALEIPDAARIAPVDFVVVPVVEPRLSCTADGWQATLIEGFEDLYPYDAEVLGYRVQLWDLARGELLGAWEMLPEATTGSTATTTWGGATRWSVVVSEEEAGIPCEGSGGAMVVVPVLDGGTGSPTGLPRAGYGGGFEANDNGATYTLFGNMPEADSLWAWILYAHGKVAAGPFAFDRWNEAAGEHEVLVAFEAQGLETKGWVEGIVGCRDGHVVGATAY